MVVIKILLVVMLMEVDSDIDGGDGDNIGGIHSMFKINS